jgi:ribonuclease BN (tRNA processing enzyme)
MAGARIMLLRLLGLLSAANLAFSGAAGAQTRCAASPLMLQVLGSGGPFPANPRASSGYLVWRQGKPIVMVDAGGGTFLRFAEAGAHIKDLSLIAISHLHPDHVADLTALLWQSDRLRDKPLKLAGPSGAGPFPPIDRFVRSLFDSAGGAFPFLAGTLGQKGTGVRLEVFTVDVNTETPARVLKEDDVEVTAVGVPHGDVPTAAFKIRVGDRSVVLGSDQNGTNPRFVDFAAGTDLLLLHLALTQGAGDAIALRHARPAIVGQVARAVRPRRLVLSHLIQATPPVETGHYSQSNLEQSVAEVRKSYQGPLDIASDLQCFPIGQP